MKNTQTEQRGKPSNKYTKINYSHNFFFLLLFIIPTQTKMSQNQKCVVEQDLSLNNTYMEDY